MGGWSVTSAPWGAGHRPVLSDPSCQTGGYKVAKAWVGGSGGVIAYLYPCKSLCMCRPGVSATGGQSDNTSSCHGDNHDQVPDRVNNQQVSVGRGKEHKRASHCSDPLGELFQQRPWPRPELVGGAESR